eukprot:7207157-Pyramimonas_sp.AAC.1
MVQDGLQDGPRVQDGPPEASKTAQEASKRSSRRARKANLLYFPPFFFERFDDLFLLGFPTAQDRPRL